MASNFHGGIAFHLPKCSRVGTERLDKDVALLRYRLDECKVEVGQSISGGEVIGSLAGTPLRSSLSSTVTAIDSDAKGILLTLTPDNEDRLAQTVPFGKRVGHTLAEAETCELLTEIGASGIIEQSGEALSDHLKRTIESAKPIRLAAACCFDLDPLCQTNLSITEEKADAVAGGLTILLRLLSVKEGAMLCDRRAKESVKAAEKACANSKLIAIETVSNRYPQANERLLTRWLMEKELSSAKKPEDAGLFLIDAEACASLYRLFAEGLPERFKRVSLFSKGKLKLVDLPLGLPLERLTEQDILPAPDADESLCRGAMDGRALPETVDATLNAIALLPDHAIDAKDCLPPEDDESDPDEKRPIKPEKSIISLFKQLSERQSCIACGRCAEVCPMFLLPYDYLPKNRLQQLLSGSPRDGYACIGCGCCSYVCPSRLPLRRAVQSSARKELSHDR